MGDDRGNREARWDVSQPVDFEQLYDDNVAAMIGQVYVLTGDLGAAQDAVQEAWIRAWMRWEHVGAYDQPVRWVRRVAMNVAVSRWRRTRRMVTGGSLPESSAADAGAGVEARIDLQRALAGLPAASRRIVVLHHLVGLSVDEIAAELDLAPGTVKSRLSRARDRLAVILTPHNEEAARHA